MGLYNLPEAYKENIITYVPKKTKYTIELRELVKTLYVVKKIARLKKDNISWNAFDTL